MLSIPQSVTHAAQQLQLSLDPSQWQALADYLTQLLEVNQRINLTAIRETEPAWHRLIIDSLTLLPALEELPDHAKVLDIGTGGGLPGIPIAIAQPHLEFTLLETTGKKCEFLRQVVEQLALPNVTILQGRAETLAHDVAHRQQYDLVVNRAVGPMPVVLEFSMPFVAVGGGMVAMKGPKAHEELKQSGDALALLGAGPLEVFEAYPPEFENDLVLVSIAKASTTPQTYPRQPGLPKKQPL